jgi:lipopolysaccharide transport system ATP-binding protein
MDLKAKGVTILFCSHSIYQVEALCEKAIWLNKGEVQAFGQAREVAQAYNQFLDQLTQGTSNLSEAKDQSNPADQFASPAWQNSPEDAVLTQENVQEVDPPFHEHQHTARLKSIDLSVDGLAIAPFDVLQSLESNLSIHVKFKAGLNLPSPNIGLVISDALGKAITSCSNFYDKVTLVRDADGSGELTLVFPKIQLLRGRYQLHVYLLCERAIHIYDSALWGEFEVEQKGLELGVVSINRRWEIQTMDK